MIRTCLVILILSVAALTTVRAQTVSCANDREVVEFSGVGSRTEVARQRACFVKTIRRSNVLVALGPHLDFDFSDEQGSLFPIVLGQCVAITGSEELQGTVACPETLPGGIEAPPVGPRALRDRPRSVQIGRPRLVAPIPVNGAAASLQFPTPPGRTSRSLGPVLRFGKHPEIPSTTAFLQAGCGGEQSSESSSFDSFRIYGPSFGEQPGVNEVGIRVEDCQLAEISNMEIAGWGGAAVEVRHMLLPDSSTNWPDTISVSIHDSYLHHNQQASTGVFGGHSSGYGVEVTAKGIARIYDNLFDFNKHSVTAGADALGVVANENLILKGGGVKNVGLFTSYIHVFDEHGTDAGNDYNGGSAAPFSYLANTFQYKNSDDIGIRGRVRAPSVLEGNIFARSSENAALDFHANDSTGIEIKGNQYNVDGFGQYDVCDFDGDGVDDLLLVTGNTWWFSSGAQFPWNFLRADNHRRDQMRFGYFDDDVRCEVLVEHPTTPGLWFTSSGGSADWKPVGDNGSGAGLNFGHPLSEVQFGRFDPRVRDHRPGVTRKTTHAFWRSPKGQWYVTPLNSVDWQPANSSNFEMKNLRFGDFDGDGVTDVLAVEDGHWAFSSAGRGPWQRLNPRLNDAVQGLFIANLDADDNIDDLLKLERNDVSIGPGLRRTTLTWWRSRNGTEPWTLWNRESFVCNPNGAEVATACGTALVGRFGAIPGDHQVAVSPGRAGAGTMTIDPWRVGHFFNPAERLSGRPAKWDSDGEEFRY